MANVSNLVKSIQDIMRKDAGTYGDAQRLEQLGWMLFLKIDLAELPPGWRWTRLPEVIRPVPYAIKRGPFGSAIRKDMFVPAGFKIYEQQHAISGDFTKGRYYINEAKFEELSAFELHPGEILVSCSGTVGKVAIVPKNIERGIINQALLKLSLHQSALLNEYFLILFPAFFMETETLTNLSGTAQKNIPSVEVLRAMTFPLPPLAEQRRIVAKVHEVMALVDALETQLAAARSAATKLLAAAVTELTHTNAADAQSRRPAQARLASAMKWEQFIRWFNRSFWRAFNNRSFPIRVPGSRAERETTVHKVYDAIISARYAASIPEAEIVANKGYGVARTIPVFCIEDYIVFYFCIKELEEILCGNRTEHTFGGWTLGGAMRRLEDIDVEFDVGFSNARYSFNPWAWRTAFGEFNSLLFAQLDTGTYSHVLQFDLSNFYDSVRLDILERWIREEAPASKGWIIALLFYFLNQWNRKNTGLHPQAVGIPQDALADCSRILANFIFRNTTNLRAISAAKQTPSTFAMQTIR
jgi:hypothetical protein